MVGKKTRHYWRSSMIMVIVIAVVAIFGIQAFAINYDLTAAQPYPKEYNIDGVIWRQHKSDGSTGTGNFDTFLGIGNDGTEKGYNTTGTLEFIPKGGAFLDEGKDGVLITDLPLVSIGGILYRELRLDVNENNNDPNWFLSLDRFQVWLSSNPNTGTYDYDALAFSNVTNKRKIYDIDASGDNTILMDYRLNNGSGWGDYKVFIPETKFINPGTGQYYYNYVVLFAEHGNYQVAGYSSSDGFEEWGHAIYEPATKTGMKFHDLDADGVKDAGDPGLGGWTIYVDYNNNGTKDLGEPFAVTASNGTYTITGILPGTWRVKEVAQAGWTQSYPELGYHEETFLSGQTYSNNDFGNWTTATKSGMKFHDLNADGDQDEGELGLAGWTIYVDYDNDGVKDAGEPSAVTGASGTYTITGINPGTWKVKEVLQAGWTQSYPASGFHEETFTSGAALTGNDFGNWTTASKSGMKFEDLDADGVKDGNELGLAGWTIYVDYDDDGVLDAGEPSAVTGADGTYTITGINLGIWKVKEVIQAGWTQSYPTSGYHEETFTSGASMTNNHFGNWAPATKSGMKFEDLNGNGAKDTDEPGLSGWTIYVDYNNDGELDAGEPFAVTDAGGTYTITGINPGTWKVKEVAQAGWTQSYPASGYHEETFTSRAALTGNDFGNWAPATKSGMKFEDLNGNGAKDTDEPGLSGWTIYVDYNNDGELDAGEPFAVTGAGGTYTITGINPGTWKVKEVAQAGWTQSYPANGYHEETFTSRAALTGNDFGNWAPATKSGTKFEDLNADGVKDAGEPGLSGWTIYVDYDDDGVLDADEPSAVTGADGTYTITGINPGTWKVKEVAQAGWTQSYPASGYHEETFTSRADLTGNDFGNWAPATKSGTKFEDLNADGIKDAGEPGLSGWTIYVDYDDDGVKDAGEPFAVTAADGTYTITGINPGTWKVKEVAQAGWTQSYPTSGYHEETFTSRAALTGNDFGNWAPATKSGMKFEDLDADGVKDAGEPGLSGWTIYVDYDDDGVKDAGEPFATTASDGTYTITGINPGTWKVKEVLQAGWTQSYPASGYHEEIFTSRAALTENDFGNWAPATKSGMKFEDLDADGIKDAGEPGLSGWTIYVDYNNDGELDAGEPFAVTGADGTYTITGINPGTWKVKEVAQTDWTQSFPALGYHEETFTSRAAMTGNDFGNWTWAKKSGYKFLDDNQNGAFDADEFGLQGWTINLWKRNAANELVLVATTLTDATGYYEFPNIKPGVTYYVSEELPSSLWTQTYPNSGTTGALMLADHPELGYVYEINLTSREHHENNDFGNWYYHDETAWARDPAKNIEFNSFVGPNNWGWTNGPYNRANVEAGIVMELWAGVGLNDINNKGKLVGSFTVKLTGDILTAKYEVFEPNRLTTVQFYIGKEMLPMKKKGSTIKYFNSPGQFPFKWTGAAVSSYEFSINIKTDKYFRGFDWTSFYIAAHADVRMFEEID